MNAEETVTTASELNNGEAELHVDTETADDDTIKDDILQDGFVSSNDKLHIEQVCKAVCNCRHPAALSQLLRQPKESCTGLLALANPSAR